MTKKKPLIQSLLQQGSKPSLAFGRESKAGRGMGKIYSGERRCQFTCAVIGSFWPGELESGSLAARILRDWSGEYIWPLVGNGDQMRKLSIINQVLVILDQLLQRLSFDSWASCYR